MEIVERIVIHPEKVRALCIKENWYTCGTNEEYSIMLAHCRVAGRGKQDQFAKDLFEIASDIYEHSEIDLTERDCDKTEYITGIMFDISNKCTTRFYMDVTFFEEVE